MRHHGPTPRRLALLATLLLLAVGPASADLDVVFVLDTTGSMSGEIREVQERVRQLAAALAAARDGERLRYGVVAYRDRGDDYVTKTFDLTGDVDAASGFLDSLVAGGGGDGPESVLAGVAAALREMSWDRGDGVERQVFLIGDAPPHLDYSGEPTPEELITEARAARIVLNTIGCRSLPSNGVEFFRSLAYGTEGSYQHIGRVGAAGGSSVTEAMSRTIGRPAATAGGREVTATWLDHQDAEAGSILVRQGGPDGIGQDREGSALGACTLEVLLPPDYALATPPRVWLAGDRLRVELTLVDGPGGRELYTLSECPPTTTPIDVLLGGE